MTMQSGGLPPVLELAEKIKLDISHRKLSPGDAYLNTQQVARRFRVNGTTANRALQVLTQRGMLMRRQRVGTFIADPQSRGDSGSIRRVHVFVHQQYLKSEGLLGDGMLVGLQRALPAAELAFNYPPPLEEVPYVEKIISEVLRSRGTVSGPGTGTASGSGTAGFVLIRSSAPVQRIFESCGIPTVVSGTLWPSIRGLASIDRDQRQIGTLLAERLVADKCARVAIFMRELLSAGDHAMLDGVFAELSRLGVPAGQIRLRCLTHDADAIQAEVSAILNEGKSRVGFLCRSKPLAHSTGAACEKLDISRSRKPSIVVADYWRRDLEELHYPHIQSTLSSEMWGEKIGNMLLELTRKVRPALLQETVPVKLV